MKTIPHILGVLALGALLTVPCASPAAAPSDSLQAAARADTLRDTGVNPHGSQTQQAQEANEVGGVDGANTEISPEERVRLKNTLQMMGRKEVEGPRLWQRRKSPKLAMYCNALMPGLGQVYNGRRIKTALMVAAASYYFGNVWLNHKSAQRYTAVRSKLAPDDKLRTFRLYNDLIEFYKEQSKDYLWWSGAVWIIGILDAWIDAHLYDIRAYTPPEVTGSAAGSAALPYLTLTVSF